MKRTDPAIPITAPGRSYVPSWAMRRVSTVVPYLPGHRGLVGHLRDHMTRNSPEYDK